MPKEYPIEWPAFFTSTIYDWKPVLQNDGFKDIIITALKFLVGDGRDLTAACTRAASPTAAESCSSYLATNYEIQPRRYTGFVYEIYCRQNKAKATQ